MLSGDQLVIRGAQKAEVSLPEVGLKEVFPNGSWLEQKQVQNALEARKHLIEAERIEKSGSMSQAEWRDDLKLAEVTKNCGGHWQYLGHNIGKRLYVYPEEALLLMESNCLLLRYNEVVVSIQQAYALLLGDPASLVQYKVYSSLSRLGYKVLRYDNTVTNSSINTGAICNLQDPKDSVQCQDQANEVIDNSQKLVTDQDSAAISDNSNKCFENVESTEQGIVGQKENGKEDKNGNDTMEIQITEQGESTNETPEVSSSIPDQVSEISNVEDTIVSEKIRNKSSTTFLRKKIEILSCRQLRPCNFDIVNYSFDENLPDLSQSQIATVKSPEEKFIPRNVFLNNTEYVLNLENLRLKNVSSTPSSSSQTYNNADETNERHVRRIRSSFSNESAQNNWTSQFFPNMRFPQQTNQFRQFNYWNQQFFNMAFQRPFFQNIPLRFQFFPRMQHTFRCFPPSNFAPNSDARRSRKRKWNSAKTYHLDAIKNLAAKLRNLVAAGNRQESNIQALQRLIQTYNIRYKTNLELTPQLEIVANEIILETIELEDDDQSNPKKRKTDETLQKTFEENLNAIKKFAIKIKELEAEQKSSPRHRRAFSNAVKTFNKTYEAEIYVDADYNVKDRRQIVITSSDSDTAVETTPKPKKSKKLRNPFYILKQLSEKQTATKTLTEAEQESSVLDMVSVPKDFKYNELLTRTFTRDWLPNENDFGRAEVIPKSQIENRLMEHGIEYLFEFMNGQYFNNWLDAKLAYWQSCKESAKEFEETPQVQSNLSLNSLVNPEDCTDMESVLRKLSIIKSNKDVKEECPFRIHFDVYNRDVQNFKKTNKPKPSFRVICIEETSNFPDGADFAAHNASYLDDITVAFAVVGVASISYIQINATDLPVYIPNSSIP